MKRLLLCSILLAGCGSPTQLVPQAPPTEQPPAPGAATLTWSAPTDNIDGTPVTVALHYRVYYGQDPARYATVDVGTEVTHVVTGLTAGVWYFEVTAIGDGTESMPSNTVSKVI